eukprot:g12046.t1
MIGPVYLQFFQATDSRAAAVLAASFGESLLTFAPQRRNAQIQYNAARPAHQHIAITPSMQISGPGFIFHVWRNAVAMMGIRRGARPEAAGRTAGGDAFSTGTENPKGPRRFMGFHSFWVA